MNDVPRKLPESGPWKGLFKWLNALRASVIARTVETGVGTKFTRTADGVTITADEKTKPGGGEARDVWF